MTNTDIEASTLYPSPGTMRLMIVSPLRRRFTFASKGISYSFSTPIRPRHSGTAGAGVAARAQSRHTQRVGLPMCVVAGLEPRTVA